MRVVSLCATLVGCVAGNQESSPAMAGFKKLTDTVSQLLEENEQELNTKQKTQEKREAECTQNEADLKTSISDKENQREQQKAALSDAESNKEAASLAFDEAQTENENAQKQLAGVEASCTRTKAEKEHEKEHLGKGVQAIEGIMDKLNDNIKIFQMAQNLVSEGQKKLKTLTDDLTNLGPECDKRKDEQQQKIDLSDQVMTEAQTEMGTADTAIADATGAIATLDSEIHSLNHQLKTDTKDCRIEIRELRAHQEELVQNISSFKSALEVLSKATTNAATSDFLQLEEVHHVTAPTGFLVKRDPKKPLLDLISKWGKTNKVGTQLAKVLLESGQSSGNVLKKVNDVIDETVTELSDKYKENVKSLEACRTKKVDLDRELKKTTDDLNDAIAALDAATSKHADQSEQLKNSKEKRTEAHDMYRAYIEQNAADQAQCGKERAELEEYRNFAEIAIKGLNNYFVNGLPEALATVVKEVQDDFKKEINQKELDCKEIRQNKDLHEEEFKALEDILNSDIARYKTNKKGAQDKMDKYQTKVRREDKKKKRIENEHDETFGEHEKAICRDHENVYTKDNQDIEGQIKDLEHARSIISDMAGKKFSSN